MYVIETVAAFREARARFGRLGFVPTMGYLHEGHLSLVRQARTACGASAVSIFVNPTQFGPHEDFARYPRDLARDLALLEREQVDLVFVPQADEVYPPGHSTVVQVGPVAEPLEGARRPGHFAGVTTVVCKLLNIVQPTQAFFGQKDAQQTVVVRQMVRDLNLPCEVVVAPTVREPDGLAMSSRNVYLTPDQRAAAPALYRALRAAEALYRGGERSAETLRGAVRAALADTSQGQIDYVSAADPLTLQELDQIGPGGALLSLAVYFGPVRLIDNLLLEGP